MRERRADRAVYRSFFMVTGVSYLVVAFVHQPSDVIPGSDTWSVLYAVAGLASIAAGFSIHKTTRGPRLWVRRVGIALVPMLLVVRAVLNVVAYGFDGVVGSVFLAWAAFVVVWAAFLLRHLPSDIDEWEDLKDEIARVRRDVRRGPVKRGTLPESEED